MTGLALALCRSLAAARCDRAPSQPQTYGERECVCEGRCPINRAVEGPRERPNQPAPFFPPILSDRNLHPSGKRTFPISGRLSIQVSKRGMTVRLFHYSPTAQPSPAGFFFPTRRTEICAKEETRDKCFSKQKNKERGGLEVSECSE